MRFRVFAALALSRENQAQVAEVLAGLQRAAPPGAVRWGRPEAMHLTVKFYGDVAAVDLAALENGLARAAAVSRPMHLTLEGLGVFPTPRRPQVIWAGVGGDVAPLRHLAEEVERTSAALGYAPEGRPYKPHLTLGRVGGGLKPAEQRQLMDGLAARQGEVFGAFHAGDLSLVRSDLRPTGSVYTTLFSAALGATRTQPAELH